MWSVLLCSVLFKQNKTSSGYAYRGLADVNIQNAPSAVPPRSRALVVGKPARQQQQQQEEDKDIMQEDKNNNNNNNSRRTRTS